MQPEQDEHQAFNNRAASARLPHTPGPWQSRHEWDWDGLCSIIGNIDGDPNSPTFTSVCDIDEGCDEFLANRNLICAAPELYEALKAVYALIVEASATGFNWRDGDWAEHLFLSQGKTFAALAKAQGKS